MALPDKIKLQSGALTNATVTNLHSLAAGDRWQSGVIAKGDPSETLLIVSYNIAMAAAFAADDYLLFGLAYGDGDTTEIWDGGIGESEGSITTAANVEALDQAIGAYQTHYGSVNHGTTVKGRKVFSLRDEDYQIIVGVEGNSLAASGSVISYRTAAHNIVD